MSWRRIRAILQKELRDYRRTRSIVGAMAVMSVIMLVVPVLLTLQQSAANSSQIGAPLFLMLVIPVVIPASVAAFSVVGERERNTLEPVLTTPIRREEFLLGKALAVLIPTLAIAYVLYGISLACIALFGQPGTIAAVLRSPFLAVLLIFTPLVAGWSIWAGIAISARSRDVRVAQQLATVASLFPLALIGLLAYFGIIQQSLLYVGIGLLVVDALGWRIVSVAFDRERLVTGAKS
jgi:ABC-type Na+ efflux pump permease subunit